MKIYTNKRFLFPFFTFLLVFFVRPFICHGQDFLVTTRLDTLNCKIGKLADDHYLIKFIDNEHIITGKIHKDSVLYYRKNLFRSMDDFRLRTWYPQISYGIDLGVAHQYGPLRTGIEKEERKLNPDLPYEYHPVKGKFFDRNAFYVGADMVFYFSPMVGYGIKYNYRSLLDGDLRYSYLAPMMVLRFWDKKRKNHIFTNLSIGYGRMTHKYALIKLDYISDPYPVDLLARTLAGDVAIGYDLKLSQHVSARFKLSTIIGFPDNVRIGNYPKRSTGGQNPAPDISGYCDNMNSINLSIGFGFH